ncbi:MAG: hypothetical protein HQP61_05225 [Peptococcaceae bacterium]|nr:hypothetical protein [Candidatus Syntrophopropionicum ammoniitolerans]
MTRLGVIKESGYLYGKKRATIYRFNDGIRIIGFKRGCSFDLRVLTIGFNPKRIGLGEGALKLLRPLYKVIYVNEINESVLPFWVKMKKRGLVNKLGTIRWEPNYEYMIS